MKMNQDPTFKRRRRTAVGLLAATALTPFGLPPTVKAIGEGIKKGAEEAHAYTPDELREMPQMTVTIPGGGGEDNAIQKAEPQLLVNPDHSHRIQQIRRDVEDYISAQGNGSAGGLIPDQAVSVPLVPDVPHTEIAPRRQP